MKLATNAARILLVLGPLVLGACAVVPVPLPIPATTRQTVVVVPAEPGSLLGQTAIQLQTAFGAPAMQVTEGTARKLQYSGPTCVLDAYLYPSAAGAEPVVTHIDTRRPTGEDFDRAACVAALSARVRP